MGKGYIRGGGFPKDKAHYFPPEMMPFAYRAACLEIVLQENEKARKLYGEILECYKLPGCVEIFNKLTNVIPEGEQLVKDIVNKSGYDFSKPPKMENLGIPYMRGLLNGGTGLAAEYAEKYKHWVLKGKYRNRDYRVLIGKVNDLIKIGFNKESEQTKGKFKLDAYRSPLLAQVIMMRPFAESHNIDFGQFLKLNVKRTPDRNYNVADVVNGGIPTRMHRNLSKEFKDSGFILKHESKMDSVVWRWYQVRVLYSGPEEYCRQMLLTKGETLDPANISNEIKDCDEALGYLRRIKEEEFKETEITKLSKLDYILLPFFITLGILLVFIGKIKTRFKR